MIRITCHADCKLLTLQVEGQLAGPLVAELEQYWRCQRQASREQAVRFDLTGVTQIDRAGRDFLAARYAEGSELIVAGCQMKAMLAEMRKHVP